MRGQKIAPWKISLQQIPAGLGLVLRLGQRAIFRGNCPCTNVLKLIKFITQPYLKASVTIFSEGLYKSLFLAHFQCQ